MNGFEGSFLGDSDRLHGKSVLECGVCWWVYDPARGDEASQIPAGTAFSDLPEHWRCPNCDTPREQFMVLEGAGSACDQGQPEIAPQQIALRQRQQELMRAYAAVDERMRSLPVYNNKLDIQVVGLRPWEEGMLCIATTPWCMNILLLPGAEERKRLEGTERQVDLPSGNYTFVAGQLPGVGAIESCSLFSPMDQFDDPAVVAEVAHHALEELVKEPVSPALSRRGFLRGGRESGERSARG